MKFKVFIVAIVSFGMLYGIMKSEDDYLKARMSFQRLMNSAHPMPEKNVYVNPNYLLKSDSSLPYFLNVNMNFEEAESEVSKMQNESSIAVNPINPNILISSAVDYRAASSTWVYLSTDKGYTWSNINLGKPFPTWTSSNDPSVAFDAAGIGYLVYGGFGQLVNSDGVLVGENGVFISKTTNNGETWKKHTPVILHKGVQTLDSTFEDKYYIQVDNSKSSKYFRDLYIPWKRVTPRDSATQIVISKSSDFGDTWSKPVNVSDRLSGSSEDTTFGQSFPLAITGPDGEVYCVWNYGPKHSIGFAKSLDGGLTFSTPKLIQTYNVFGKTTFITGQGYRHTVKNVVRAESYPSIVCDIYSTQRKGSLYLCWSADNYPNVYFSKSVDGGNTWSKAKVIHSDTTNDQFWHWLSIDPKNGDLAVMYLDSRNDPSNIMVECYVSYSSDGGDTWTDRKVSDINSDLRLNPFGSQAFAGDYSGNAFYDGIIYPSWVDMRNAAKNINDSDVFTAVVNTKASAPVENLTSIVSSEEPNKVDLNWLNPKFTTFGKTIDTSKLKIRVQRSGTQIGFFSSNVNKLLDDKAKPFEKNSYTVTAVYDGVNSIDRTVLAYAGGSRYPLPPELLSLANDGSLNSKLLVKIPTMRSDSITKLTHISELKVIENFMVLSTQNLVQSDTGTTKSIDIQVPEDGFYRFQATINDKFPSLDIVTESKNSDELNSYVGKTFTNFTENFDGKTLPKLFKSGNWQLTSQFAHSAPNSITESPNGNYTPLQSDTLIVLPVYAEGNLDFRLEFWHACIVRRDDSAFIQISYDKQKTWTNFIKFNEDSYAPWKDGKVNPDDWKFESFSIPKSKSGNDTLFVRFMFKSNKITFADGWFIDDILLTSRLNDVKDNNTESNIKVYPNPVNDFLNIYSQQDILSVEIFNILGENVVRINNINKQDFLLKFMDIPSGAYLVKIHTNEGIKINQIIKN